MLLSQLFGFSFARDFINHGTGNAERGEDTHEDTHEEREDESADNLTTEDKHHQQSNESGARSVYSTGKSGVDCVVHMGHQVAFRVKLAILTDAVENNHSGVDGVTDNSQHGRDEVLVNLKVEGQQTIEQGEESDNQDGIMGQSGDKPE